MSPSSDHTVNKVDKKSSSLAADLGSGDASSRAVLVRRTHRDFLGVEDADKPTREALVNFSYHLTVGNVDEAFRSISSIKR